jgi:hypothetical protein
MQTSQKLKTNEKAFKASGKGGRGTRGIRRLVERGDKKVKAGLLRGYKNSIGYTRPCELRTMLNVTALRIVAGTRCGGAGIPDWFGMSKQRIKRN